MPPSVALSLVLALIQYVSIEAVGNFQEICAACRVMVDEIESEISNTDPHKLLDVAGFRVDPSGNQKSRQIKYARSETHLTEVSENLCDQMQRYAKSSLSPDDTKYIMMKTREGKPVPLPSEALSLNTDEEEKTKLRNICHQLVEEHEESIIDYFKKPSSNSRKEFCGEMIGVCMEDDDEDGNSEEEEAKEEL